MQKFIGNIKGKDAQQPNFSFVTPDTLPPGSQSTVQNLGSAQHPVLKFGIAQGPQGAVGAKGDKGDRGEKGDSGNPGRDGTSPKVRVHGTTFVDAEEDVRVENLGTDQSIDLQFFLKRPPEEITIDEELIENSTNPVQSKAIQEALDLKADSSSIPTKVSELTNDRNFVSESSVNIMIEDAVEAAAIAANPVDDELSDTSVNAVQNKVVNSALAEKVEMEITDAIDNNNTQYGEIVTLRNKDREVSMVLTGDNIESVVLSQNFAERIPTIVSELPTEGSLDRLYLVPSSGDNYSMHIWMDVDGVERWVNIQSGGNVDLSGYASKNEAIKNISRNGTTFTATRADNTTFTFTQQDDTIRIESVNISDLNAISIGQFTITRCIVYKMNGYIVGLLIDATIVSRTDDLASSARNVCDLTGFVTYINGRSELVSQVFMDNECLTDVKVSTAYNMVKLNFGSPNNDITSKNNNNNGKNLYIRYGLCGYL